MFDYSQELANGARQVIEHHYGPVDSVEQLSESNFEGDTSRAARVVAKGGGLVRQEETTLAVKWAYGNASGGIQHEVEGLRALDIASPDGIVVPQPLFHRRGVQYGISWIVLPWVQRGDPTVEDWCRFGASLAELHRSPAPGDAFGWHTVNRIGSKPQRNAWVASWPNFFGEFRLRAQAKTVRSSVVDSRLRPAWDPAWDNGIDRIASRLPDLLPSAPPRSLVHGDLWVGNALPMRDGRFALIDPAVYVGHREVDLAMTELFGGFPPAFYDGYREAWPLEPGYPERREVYNLFHLINHLTHGLEYRAPVEATLHRFGA